MNELYIYHSLLTFAKNLIGIFIPIYLFKLGYNIIEILKFSIGYSIMFLIFIPLTIKIIRKIGFKYTLLLTMPIYLSHIVCLNFIPESKIFFHLSWISEGIYNGIFWPAYHSEVALNGSNKYRSSQMGTFQILTTLFGSCAPIIGGFILDYQSFWWLFVLANIFIFIGTIPLLISKDIKLQNYNFKYKDYLKLIKNKQYFNSKLVFSFNGLQSTLIILVWPIILFIYLNKSFFAYGTLMTIISFISIFIILYLKTFFNTTKNIYYKKITKTESLAWLSRSIIYYCNLGFLFFVEGVSKLFHYIQNLLFFSIFYNNAKKVGYMKYIILRELYLHTTKIFFAIILIFILTILGDSLFILTLIAFLGIFISIGMSLFKEIIS